MAALTGTSSTYSVGTGGGNREDLEDVIWDLFPEDTYALTNFDKVSASATTHEWLGDSLASPNTNIAIEGNDATYATIANAARYSNQLQIVEKTFLVSGTQEKVAKAGRKTESGRQAMKKMRELKNDAEYALVRNAIATAGSATVGRSLAGIESWIGEASTSDGTTAANVVRATSTSSATTTAISSGAPATAPVDGTTTGALTESVLKNALQGAWEDGGSTDIILVSANVKKTIDGFTGVATRNIDIGKTDQAVITGAANLYVTSFGVHKVVLHRHVRSSVALCLDTDLWAVAFLRPFEKERLAKTGDAVKWAMRGELTLVARNYKGNSKVVAIT